MKQDLPASKGGANVHIDAILT